MTVEVSSKMGPLFAALAEAAKAAGAVGKGARNEFHKYKYASAESIYEEGRTALHGNGLALVPVAETLSGDVEKGYFVDLQYMLTHSSGESMLLHRTWPVVPDRGRPLDKALAAALTTALSYLVRDLLLLPRVDEEVDRREDKPQEKAPPRHAPAAKRADPPRREATPDVNDAPPGVEADDLREQINYLMPQVPVEKQAAVLKAVKAAGDDLVRLRAGLKFVRDIVDAAQTTAAP